MMIGADISHFHIIEKIGEGGMGVVYKAEDTRLHRFVALKVLRSEALGDPDAKKRFLREAHAASLLSHTNITTIYDIDTWQGQDFIVLEYIEGQTLKKIILNAELGMMNVIDYALQIAEALKEAHQHNIIHRDIKCENIIITPEGRIKVMDFGLAKMADSMTKTKDRPTMGTIAYMSPEQTKGKGVDFRTDIWSFGVVLYEMLTRELPFKGDYEQAVIYSILNEEPQKVSALRPDVPLALEHIVCKALAKKKDARYNSALDLVNELRSVFESKKLTRSKKQDQQNVDDGVQVRKIKRTFSTKKRGLFLALTVSLFIIVFALVFKTIQQKTSRFSRPIETRLTSYEHLECYPALSPDGSKLAFTWNGEKGDNYDIYFKLIGEDRCTRLTSDPANEFSATWSHDGNYLAFVRYGENGGIYYKSIFGGPEKMAVDISQKWARSDIETRVDWSPVGPWLAYNDYDSLQHTNYLFRLDLDSGEREQITSSAPGIVGDRNPKFSPNGQWVAFERAYGFSVRELFLLNLKSRAVKQLTFDKKQIDDLAWTADGKKIIFISNREGISRLWSVGINGGQLQPLAIGGDRTSTISIARKGHRLVYATIRFWTDIWQADIPGDSGQIKPHRLITSPYLDYFPVYSPDEQKIAFNSDRSGNCEVYICNRDGSDPRRMTFLESHSGVPRWSPSGEYLIFDSRPKGNSDILRIDAKGDKPPVNLTDNPADDRVPSWSRDGRYIYFYSKRSEKYQIYRMPAAGGEPVQITQNGGNMGFESFDGSYFYFKKFQDMKGWIYRINLRTREESVAVEEFVSAFRWSVEKNGIYYIAADQDNNPVLKLYHQDTGRVEKLGTFKDWFNFWDVSKNGKSILLWYCDDHAGDIYMVENFR